jgi:glutathione synthase/RimK-type ligase-like ATP-grasp enzyme
MSQPWKIGFVTYSRLPDLAPDDHLLRDVLQSRGFLVQAVSWDDAAFDWNTCDAYVFRSCWNYFERPLEFKRWLERMGQLKKPFLNSLATVQWNHDKNYLKRFERAGIDIVQTSWSDSNCSLSLKEVFARNRWSRAVVKPTISGTSLHTWVATVESLGRDQARLDALLAEREMMVQEYVSEIETAGEWSLVFLGGRYSHAVRKLPAAGDFRVQSEFGGLWHAAQAPRELSRLAERIHQVVEEDLLYVRIDGIEARGRFLLMEFEALEPSLFFAAAPAAAMMFADQLEQRLLKYRSR